MYDYFIESLWFSQMCFEFFWTAVECVNVFILFIFSPSVICVHNRIFHCMILNKRHGMKPHDGIQDFFLKVRDLCGGVFNYFQPNKNGQFNFIIWDDKNVNNKSTDLFSASIKISVEFRIRRGFIYWCWFEQLSFFY